VKDRLGDWNYFQDIESHMFDMTRKENPTHLLLCPGWGLAALLFQESTCIVEKTTVID
jgi:hypothetical protein